MLSLRRLRTAAGAVVLTFAIWLPSGATTLANETNATEAASRLLDDLGRDAVAVLNSASAPEQQQSALKQLVQRGFDLQLIGKLVLGRHWREVSPEQRQEYQTLFARYVLDTYTPRLMASGGTGFAILGTQTLEGDDVLVKTRLERSDGPPVEAGWRVRLTDNEPRIIDVVLEGVSMALTQREEFNAVIKREGFDGLLKSLRDHGSANQSAVLPPPGRLALAGSPPGGPGVGVEIRVL